MRNIKWLFFDLGSTLVDESQVYERRFQKIADAAGVPVDTIKEKATAYYKKNEKGDLEVAREYSMDKPLWEHEYEVLYPDTVQLLEELSKDFKIGAIANQPLGTVDRLEAFGILKYFNLVVASAEEGVAKPDKRIFEIALERAGCAPEEAFMIGDRIDNDIIPAKEMKMHALWVKQGFGGLWTFTEQNQLPDYLTDDIKEIPSILDFHINSKSLLETTMNTRDLGGRICKNGEKTKPNRIYRSDKQNRPSKRDIEFLKENGITTIIDLREEEAVQYSPSGFMNREGFDYFNFPIIEGAKIPESVEAVPGSYMKIAKSLPLKGAFQKIAEAESGVMINCSAGKDRTGTVTAILLMLCGVKDEEIVADYMRTKECTRERMKLVMVHHPDVDLNIIIPNETYIKDFMKMFREKYGSAEGYMKSIGLDDETIGKLRNKLLGD